MERVDYNIHVVKEAVSIAKESEGIKVKNIEMEKELKNSLISGEMGDVFEDSFDSTDTVEKETADSFEDDFDEQKKVVEQSVKPMYSMSKDVFEDFNRSVYNFNAIFYQTALAPVAKTYNLLTTEEIRNGISNVLYNLQSPFRILLNILQGKFQNAGIEFSRFIVNTTVGLLGFVDVAARDTPASYTIESVNTTLATWKIPSGPFLMLPFLGPTTVRRTASYIIEGYANPMKYVWRSPVVSPSITAARITNDSPFYLDLFYKVEDTSFEPYAATREFFLQIDSVPRKL
ncbi:MAG: MlaA family lipoprotein [Desulfovibrionaceae bacterium]